MDTINLAEKLVQLRHQKKITQENLADFLGITKASVSKWETRQSMPDIMLLPQLAAYYDVTVDELLSYEPQLSKEQIQKLYREFSTAFSEQPFWEVMEETRVYVKRYYSCYPFLFQIAVLWLNHFFLVEEKEKQEEILKDILSLFQRIQNNCKSKGLCTDSLVLEAVVHLQLGHAQEVIESLSDFSKPQSIAVHASTLLTQAYMIKGDLKMAESFSQLSMYNNIIILVNTATKYINICGDKPQTCITTIERIDNLISSYEMIKLHPNEVALYEYQATLYFLSNGDKANALSHTMLFIESLEELFSMDEIKIHGDAYFTHITEFYNDIDSGNSQPRSRKLILADAKCSFQHPLFALLEAEPKFHMLKLRLNELA